MASSIILPIKTVFDDKGLKNAQQQFGQFGGSMKKLVGGVAAAVSIGAIVSTLTNAAKAASEDAKSQALLATQLRNTAGASDEVISSVESQVQALSNMAGVVDDEIRPAFAQLVRATGDVGTASDLTATALDIAAAKGISVSAAATALGKAAQGSTGALAKLGINVKGLADPLASVQEQFKGAAAAAANANPFQRLTIILDNLKETLGAAVLPLVSSLADAIISAQPAIESFFGALKPVFDAIKPLIEKLTPLFTRIMGTVGRLLSSLLPPIMKVLDAVLVALTPFVDLILNLVDTILPPLTEILNKYLVPAFDALAKAMANPNSYISQLSTALGDTLYLALQLVVEYLGYLKTAFDAIMTALQPVIQGFNDWAKSMGIDPSKLIAALNPLMVALTSLQVMLATAIWSFKLLDAAMHLDFATFGKLMAAGPLAVLTELKNKAKGAVDETQRLLNRQANKAVQPLTPGGGTPTPPTTQAKAAADAAKKYADAYAKILETEKAIREAATAAAMESRSATLAMRDAFVKLLDGVKPLQRAGAEIGEFEQQVVDSFEAIEEQITSSLADGTLLADAAANLRAYAATEKMALASIARQRDALTKKLDIAKAISADVLAFGNINGLLEKQTNTVTETFTRMVDGIQVATTRSFEQVTSGGLVDNFKKVIDKTKAFAKNLIELKRLGLNGQLFKQIVEAGVDAGGDTAQAIAEGGSATVGELNDLFGQLNDLGGQVAAASTDVMYQAGEDVMNSFIQSLLDQDSALRATAVTLAESFANAFRNSLVSLAPLMALPTKTSEISLSDALTGYVSDELGRSFTGPYNYYGQQMVGGLGANYNITINAGAVAEKASLPGLIVDALATYTRQSGSGALNRVLNIA
jgi:phage-related protein